MSYGEGKPNQLLAVIGSSGMLEIAVNLGSAKQLLDCREGDEVAVIYKK
jgi:S-adenosylmethionine hydrolase